MSELSSTQRDRLVDLMYTMLPQGLVDQIEETIYYHAFCPGVMFLPLHFSPPEATLTWRVKPMT